MSSCCVREWVCIYVESMPVIPGLHSSNTYFNLRGEVNSCSHSERTLFVALHWKHLQAASASVCQMLLQPPGHTTEIVIKKYLTPNYSRLFYISSCEIVTGGGTCIQLFVFGTSAGEVGLARALDQFISVTTSNEDFIRCWQDFSGRTANDQG